MKRSSNGTLRLYADSARESALLLRRHWLIIPATFGLILTWGLAAYLIGIISGGLPFLGLVFGLMLGLAQAACLGTFYGWVGDVSLSRAPVWKQFRYETFMSVISMGFFLFLIQLSVRAIQGADGTNAVSLFVQLALVIWCNPMPEIIQHIAPDSMNGAMLCYEFMKEQGIAWLGAMLLVMSPLLLLSGPSELLTVIGSMNPLFPLGALIVPWITLASSLFDGAGNGYTVGAITLLISSILGLWTMVFRSVLFQRLSGRR